MGQSPVVCWECPPDWWGPEALALPISMEQKEFTGRGLHYSLVSVEIDGLMGANPVTCLSSEERGKDREDRERQRQGETGRERDPSWEESSKRQ